MVTLKLNSAELRRATRELMRRTQHNTLPKFLRWRARLAALDLTKWMPPRGKNPGSESWAQQKQRGLTAVARDIRRVFQWLGKIAENARDKAVERGMKRALARGDFRAAEDILTNLRIPVAQVMQAVDPRLHRKAQDRFGHVRGKQANLVVRKGTISSYIRTIQADVGKGKAGWGRACQELGAKGIPAWVTRHAAGGSIQLNIGKSLRQFIRLIHSGFFTGNTNGAEIVNAALTANKNKIIKELARIFENEKKKAGFK